MPTLGDLLVRVGADLSGFRGAMGDVADEAARGMQKVEREFRSFDKIAQNLKSVGVAMTAAITAPLVGIGAIATKEFNAFELAMRQVTSLMGKEGNAAFKQLSDQTLELSKRMGIDAVKASQALYEAISAGVPKENAMTFLEVSSKTAIAGVTDTKVAVDGLTSVMNAYQLEVSQTEAVSDAMFQAVNIGKFTFAELAATMSTAIPLASSLGVGFKEVLGAAASLTSQGFKISEAMTSIQSAMKGIISPNKEMNMLLEKTGFSTGQALISTKGFHGALMALREAAHGNVQVLTDAFGRVEALGAALKLTGTFANKAALDIANVSNASGATAFAFEQIEQSSSRMIDRMVARFDVLKISIGRELKDAFASVSGLLESFINQLIQAVDWFSKLPTFVKNTAIAFAGVAAAIGPVLFAVGKSIELFKDFTKAGSGLSVLAENIKPVATAMLGLSSGASVATIAITALVPAIAGAVAALAAFRIGEVIVDLAKFAQESVSTTNAFKAIADAAKFVTDQLGLLPAVKLITIVFKQAGDNFLDVLKGATGIAGIQKLVAGELIPGLKDQFSGLSTDIAASLKKSSKAALDAGTAAAKLAADNVVRAHEAAAEAAQRASEKAAEASKKAAQAMKEAFSELGLKDYRKDLKEAEKAYADLSKAGVLSAQQQVTALENIRQKRIALIETLRTPAEATAVFNEQMGALADKSFALARAFTALHVEGQKIKFATLEYEAFNAALNKIDGSRSLDIFQRLNQDMIDSSRSAIRLREDLDILGVKRAESIEHIIAANKRVQESDEATLRQKLQSELNTLKAIEDNRRLVGERMTSEEKKRMAELGKALGDTVKTQTELFAGLGRQISTILTDMGKGLADAILHSKSLGEVFTKTANAIKEAILRTIIENGTRMLLNELKALDFSFTQLGKNIAGIAKEIGSLFGLIKKAPPLPFPGLSSEDLSEIGKVNIPSTTGAAGTATSTAGGTAGGAGAGGISGLIPGLDLIASAISAGFTAWQTFIQRRMEKDIGRIEVTTREIFSQLLSIQDDVNKYWPWLMELKWLSAIHGAIIQLQDMVGGIPTKVGESVADPIADGLEQGLQETVAEPIDNLASVISEIENTSAVWALQSNLFRRVETDIGRIEVTARGQLSQLISLQDTANKYWPWLESINGTIGQLIDTVSAGFDTLSSGLKTIIVDTSNAISATIAQAADGTVDAIAEVAENVGDLIDENVSEAIEHAADMLGSGIENVAAVASSGFENVAVASTAITDAVDTASQAIVESVGDAADQITSAVAENGMSSAAAEVFDLLNPFRRLDVPWNAPHPSFARITGSPDYTTPRTIIGWEELPPWTWPQNYMGSVGAGEPVVPTLQNLIDQVQQLGAPLAWFGGNQQEISPAIQQFSALQRLVAAQQGMPAGGPQVGMAATPVIAQGLAPIFEVIRNIHEGPGPIWDQPGTMVGRIAPQRDFGAVAPQQTTGMDSNATRSVQINIYAATTDERALARRLVQALSDEGIRV